MIYECIIFVFYVCIFFYFKYGYFCGWRYDGGGWVRGGRQRNLSPNNGYLLPPSFGPERRRWRWRLFVYNSSGEKRLATAFATAVHLDLDSSSRLYYRPFRRIFWWAYKFFCVCVCVCILYFFFTVHTIENDYRQSRLFLVYLAGCNFFFPHTSSHAFRPTTGLIIRAFTQTSWEATNAPRQTAVDHWLSSTATYLGVSAKQMTIMDLLSIWGFRRIVGSNVFWNPLVPAAT